MDVAALLLDAESGIVEDSFTHLPLLSIGMSADLFDLLLGFLATSMELAIRLAAPMLVTMLVVDLALGLIGKMMPQMNVMAMGMSLRSALGLVVLILGLTVTTGAIGDGLLEAMNAVRAAWVSG